MPNWLINLKSGLMEVGEGESVDKEEVGEGDEEEAHDDEGRWWLCTRLPVVPEVCWWCLC